MKTLPLFCCSFVLLVGCSEPSSQPLQSHRYAIFQGADGPFLVDQPTGKVWQLQKLGDKEEFTPVEVSMTTPVKKKVSLAQAMKLPINRGKTPDEVIKDIQDRGYDVIYDLETNEK